MSQQINLFNPLFLKQKKHFSAITIAQALGVLLVGALGFYAYAYWQVDGLEKQARDGARQQQLQQERLTRLTAQVGAGKQDPAEQELRDLQASIASRQALIASMGSAAPGAQSGYAEYMRAIARQIQNGLWLTGFHIGEGGGEFLLSGRSLQAELVPAYIRRLGSEPVMRGRNLDELTMTAVAQAVPPQEGAKAGAPAAVTVIEFNIGTSHAVIESVAAAATPASGAAPATAGAAKALP